MFNIFKSKVEKRLDKVIADTMDEYKTSKKYKSYSSIDRCEAILQALLLVKTGKRVYQFDED